MLTGALFVPPPLAPRSRQSRAAIAVRRAVAFRTADAHGLYAQLGFLPAGETVMQRPRSVTE
jgi:hypothetical protein